MLKTKPLVSFVMLAYNQEKYIEAALEGAFAQTYSPLEIILSDDGSNDSTFSLMQAKAAMYEGPHRVKVRQTKKNNGLADHFNTVISLAKGEIIVIASGDDISLPNRTTNTVELLANNPTAKFISFMDIVIDEHGNEVPTKKARSAKEVAISLEDHLNFTTTNLSGASRGFRKEIFEIFGALRTTCPTEDTPHILRGLILGEALVSPIPGIKYRVHGNNLSGPASLPFLSLEEIRHQYLQDTAVALSTGLISQDGSKRLQRWIDKNHHRRLLQNEFSQQAVGLKYFWQKLLFSQSFSMFEKLVLLRSLIAKLIR
tara:strand:- start:124 stop:1065 length:942 start_codon:yes stop_codon:yes gene_type:complete